MAVKGAKQCTVLFVKVGVWGSECVHQSRSFTAMTDIVPRILSLNRSPSIASPAKPAVQPTLQACAGCNLKRHSPPLLCPQLFRNQDSLLHALMRVQVYMQLVYRNHQDWTTEKQEGDLRQPSALGMVHGLRRQAVLHLADSCRRKVFHNMNETHRNIPIMEIVLQMGLLMNGSVQCHCDAAHVFSQNTKLQSTARLFVKKPLHSRKAPRWSLLPCPLITDDCTRRTVDCLWGSRLSESWITRQRATVLDCHPNISKWIRAAVPSVPANTWSGTQVLFAQPAHHSHNKQVWFCLLV